MSSAIKPASLRTTKWLVWLIAQLLRLQKHRALARKELFSSTITFVARREVSEAFKSKNPTQRHPQYHFNSDDEWRVRQHLGERFAKSGLMIRRIGSCYAGTTEGSRQHDIFKVEVTVE